jgi:hypothetical protein
LFSGISKKSSHPINRVSQYINSDGISAGQDPTAVGSCNKFLFNPTQGDFGFILDWFDDYFEGCDEDKRNTEVLSLTSIIGRYERMRLDGIGSDVPDQLAPSERLPAHQVECWEPSHVYGAGVLFSNGSWHQCLQLLLGHLLFIDHFTRLERRED